MRNLGTLASRKSLLSRMTEAFGVTRGLNEVPHNTEEPESENNRRKFRECFSKQKKPCKLLIYKRH